jgi:DNA-binding NarL/FixJ family response regulator
VLTTFDLDQYVYDALKAGASGFMLKDSSPEQLTDAIRVVAEGGAMLSPTLTRRLIEDYVSRPPAAADDGALLERYGLTEREGEIWKALSRGLSNAEIGQALHVSEATVKTHVTRIFDKLQVRDRLQAAVMAYEVGAVRTGGDG